MRILAFAASVRKESFNKKLIALAATHLRGLGHEVDLADFREFDMPLYDADLNATQGLPAGAASLVKRLNDNDVVVISSPEYNYSVPGTLKNAIDWVSRANPVPLKGKPILLLSASPAEAGGHRGLWQLRIPLEGCLAVVNPDMFSLSKAHEAFAADGQLANKALAARLGDTLQAFVTLSSKVLAKSI